jgi:TetR/AcrR family transcriptional regulator, lmrAB and yxaGH operons repressor
VDNVKQRMVQKAALSLATKGLQRTSFSEVLKASSAPRGSLYHHFPGGKDELVLDALQLAGEWAMQSLGLSAGRPAPDIARAFIDLWRFLLTRSDFGSGCAVAAVTVAAETPALLDRSAAVFQGWRSRIAALLAEGGIPGDRAQTLATTLIAGCEGAVILARAERSLVPFDVVATELIAAVVAALGRQPSR